MPKRCWSHSTTRIRRRSSTPVHDCPVFQQPSLPNHEQFLFRSRPAQPSILFRPAPHSASALPLFRHSLRESFVSMCFAFRNFLPTAPLPDWEHSGRCPFARLVRTGHRRCVEDVHSLRARDLRAGEFARIPTAILRSSALRLRSARNSLSTNRPIRSAETNIE